jgi:hypothetical protein
MTGDERTWCEPYRVSQNARSCAAMHVAGATHAATRGPDAHRRNAACETCEDGRLRAIALGLVTLARRDPKRPAWRAPACGRPVDAYEPRTGQP